MRYHPGPWNLRAFAVAMAALAFPCFALAQTTPTSAPASAPAATPATPTGPVIVIVPNPQNTTQNPAPTDAPSTSPAAPAPIDIASLTPAKLAQIAAQRIHASEQAITNYTYFDTEHTQQFIDGAKMVDHTTVSESIFIGGLPYLRKISYDGKPLEGKELIKEQKLYDDAVRDRKSLDVETRARLTKTARRSPSHTDLDQLAKYFHLTIEPHATFNGKDCVVLDATPIPQLDFPSVQRHIRIAMDPVNLNLMDVRIEFLVADEGFQKGTVLDTQYKDVNGVTLISQKTTDALVQFKELLDRPIRVYTVGTYDKYRRFRATVTIEAVGDQPFQPETQPDPPQTGPSRAINLQPRSLSIDAFPGTL